MQARQMMLTPGQTEYDHQENAQSGPHQQEVSYGAFIGMASHHMRGGLLSASSQHHGYAMFAENSRFEDPGDQFATDHVRQMQM